MLLIFGDVWPLPEGAGSQGLQNALVLPGPRERSRDGVLRVSVAKVTGRESAQQAPQRARLLDFPGWAEPARERSNSF